MLKKPGRNRTRVGLLVGTVVQVPGNFRFRGRPESREGRRCGGRGADSGDSAEELADKERRSLDILSVKKVTRLSASELA